MVSKNAHIFGVQITGKMVSKLQPEMGLILEAILPFFSPEMGPILATWN